MQRMICCVIALLTLTLFSSSAAANITFDAIVPSSPTANEIVSIQVSDGGCDAIIEAIGYPQVSQSGNSIRVVIESLHYDNGMLCIFEPATGLVPIGRFPIASYSLQVDRHYLDFFGRPVLESLGSASFSVSGGVSHTTALPALRGWGLLLMIFGMGLLATISGYHRIATKRSD